MLLIPAIWHRQIARGPCFIRTPPIPGRRKYHNSCRHFISPGAQQNWREYPDCRSSGKFLSNGGNFQIDIDSFTLEKELESGRETVDGFAVLDFERYNNSGFHAVAVFKRLNNTEPLEYNTKYYGSIQYREEAEVDDSADPYDKTYSWSFTTDLNRLEGGSGSGGKFGGCFIGTMFD